MAQIELPSLVTLTQGYIAKNYAVCLIDCTKTAELKAYIGKYLYDTGYTVAGYDTKSLVERLYEEMAEYSIHAVDVIKKLLLHSGMTIDNATPIAQGHLPDNIRITALKEPIVDADRGIAVSIRMLHPQRVDMILLDLTAIRDFGKPVSSHGPAAQAYVQMRIFRSDIISGLR